MLIDWASPFGCKRNIYALTHALHTRSPLGPLGARVDWDHRRVLARTCRRHTACEMRRSSWLGSASAPLAAVFVDAAMPWWPSRAWTWSECVNVNYNNRPHASLAEVGRVLKSVFNCAIYVCCVSYKINGRSRVSAHARAQAYNADAFMVIGTLRFWLWMPRHRDDIYENPPFAQRALTAHSCHTQTHTHTH